MQGTPTGFLHSSRASNHVKGFLIMSTTGKSRRQTRGLPVSPLHVLGVQMHTCTQSDREEQASTRREHSRCTHTDTHQDGNTTDISSTRRALHPHSCRRELSPTSSPSGSTEIQLLCNHLPRRSSHRDTRGRKGAEQCKHMNHARADTPALSNTRCALHPHRLSRELRPANSLSGSTESWLVPNCLPRRASPRDTRGRKGAEQRKHTLQQPYSHKYTSSVWHETRAAPSQPFEGAEPREQPLGQLRDLVVGHPPAKEGVTS